MGFNVRTETERAKERISGLVNKQINNVNEEMKSMKKNVKQKAKRQIDDLIENLKTNEFLKHPGIKNLIDKVSSQKDLNQMINKKVEEVVDNVRNDVVAKVEIPVQKASKAVRRVKEASPKQLLDLIKTSDVANRIAKSILSGAENINQKWLEKVGSKKKTKSTKTTKSAKTSAGTKPKQAAKKKSPNKTKTTKSVKKTTK